MTACIGKQNSMHSIFCFTAEKQRKHGVHRVFNGNTLTNYILPLFFVILCVLCASSATSVVNFADTRHHMAVFIW